MISLTPFVPLAPDDSGLPCGILRYRVKNTSRDVLDVALVGSMCNPIDRSRGHVNKIVAREDFTALSFTGGKDPEDPRLNGDAALVVLDQPVTCKTAWLRGDWWDAFQDFWDDFADDGKLHDNTYPDARAPGAFEIGSIGSFIALKPGESHDFTFIIAWYFPIRLGSWNQVAAPTEESKKRALCTRYASRFTDAFDVVQYAVANRARLERASRAFRDAFFESTLPAYVLDAVSANITAARSV